ncbi:MAG TPA: type I-U CRISPR-associated RAMP protein Csb1/Cas7u [Fibrobacteraceae bacterium]|nr:type I-U CRISPR-associated RAMP protein Csb1/Cas7u [Fibrobacteraceae bacterium]
MSIDLKPLERKSRLLFEIPLRPIQGHRFQPTGFPNLGAATFKSNEGDCLLVESAQSMANRLEMTIWDSTKNDVIDSVKGISHVRVERKNKDDSKAFLTDSIIEAHRLNSPYLLEGSNKSFFNDLKQEVGAMEEGIPDRKKLAEVLLKYDVGSLLHGVFLAKKELAGGRLRIARALSAFVEATGVQVAASGGVKNDAVNPSGETKKGFGNIPFSRDEYTANKIILYVNLDLSQIRAYGFDADTTAFLILLALYKVARLIQGEMRFRTACDFDIDHEKIKESIVSSNIPEFVLPTANDLETELKEMLGKVKDKMPGATVEYNDKLEKKADKEKESEETNEDNE